MAVDLEAALPPLLQQRLGATRGDVTGLAVPVCTVDREGLPHPAMLSYSELSSDDPQTLRAVVAQRLSSRWRSSPSSPIAQPRTSARPSSPAASGSSASPRAADAPAGSGVEA